MIQQEEYMKKVADLNYDVFLQQGYATAGHNGPHGHLDTPVRNTSHYLIIYSYLYKKTQEGKYLKICDVFANYLFTEQSKSKSGAIQCMRTNRFDYLNGLIGQGWVIEALLYYYEISKDIRCIEVAKKIFFSQKYDWDKHLWYRIELDGSNIGIDPTYNHQSWFAACSYKLNDYCDDNKIDEIITDFLKHGSERDVRIYPNGMLRHTVNIITPITKKIKRRTIIKYLLTPIRWVNIRKFDPKYMEYAYHIFDLYGLCILKERYQNLPIFSSEKFKKAVDFAMDIDTINKKCGITDFLKRGKMFNVYSYSYNCPTFELPYVAISNNKDSDKLLEKIFSTLNLLMWDKDTEQFTKYQPDIETWNARTYEIIRYLEKHTNNH